jgi:hypothetical protein
MENWLAKSILLGAVIFAAIVIYKIALDFIKKIQVILCGCHVFKGLSFQKQKIYPNGKYGLFGHHWSFILSGHSKT